MTSTGLRTLPFTIRLVDAAYFAVPRCVSCNAREDKPHHMYCMTQLVWRRCTPESEPREQ